MSRFWIFLAVAWLVFAVLDHFKPYDPTDDAARGERSGMSFYVDHGTGCHYIAKPIFGSLSPRLDRDGNHVCEGQP